MKKTKILILPIFLVMCCVVFVSCFGGPKVKVFEKDGIKITATDSFQEKSLLTATLYLESLDKIITATKEVPNSQFPITKTLREYTELVLYVNTLSGAAISIYDDNDVVFEYFTYTKSISGKSIKYLGVTKKSDSYFYLFNFACEEKNFDKNETQFLSWAKLIEVI